MNIKELKAVIANLPDETEVFVATSDMGFGTDVVFSLDQVIKSSRNKIAFGATQNLCGDGPYTLIERGETVDLGVKFE